MSELENTGYRSHMFQGRLSSSANASPRGYCVYSFMFALHITEEGCLYLSTSSLPRNHYFIME